MMETMLRYSRIREIVGDILRVFVPRTAGEQDYAVRLGDLAVIEDGPTRSLAQVIGVNRDTVSLQVYSGTNGISTTASVTFLGRPMQVAYSPNVLGRVFNGAGETVDSGPDLRLERQVAIGGPSVNPVERVVPKKMIRTNVPMIDVFNCLVESQKIPIFSVSGEPYNPFLARIGIQADADIVVFGGMGLIFDDFHTFRTTFEDSGLFSRTIMFVNQASDPLVERLLVPDLALAVAEHFGSPWSASPPTAATWAICIPSSRAATRRRATTPRAAPSPSCPSPPCRATT